MICNPALEILIATHNPGKIREVQEALHSLPVKFRYLREFPEVSAVNEVGRTYEENAVLKALGYAKQTGVCAVADDSGLEVDALGGNPGVFSARFGGEHASDCDRIEKLLTALSRADKRQRTAHFVCSMALAGWQSGRDRLTGADPALLTVTQARCEGAIATTARGLGGFGFDPVFVPAGYQATFAELPAKVKDRISHRAQAGAAISMFLDRWLAHT